MQEEDESQIIAKKRSKKAVDDDSLGGTLEIVAKYVTDGVARASRSSTNRQNSASSTFLTNKLYSDDEAEYSSPLKVYSAPLNVGVV
jgi:hypothetical protein